MINGHRENHVIMPSVDCFVTPDIADKLSKVSTAELAPAAVRCVYVYPYSPGDDSYDREPFSRSTEDVERDFYYFVSHCPKGQSSIEYIEVRPRLLSEFKGLPSNKRVRVGAPAQGAGFVDIQLSADVVRQHGILATEGLVLSEAAYAVLKEHVSNVFFHVEKIEL